MCDYITIVSGLPRSGTSMMMQCISKGGIEPLVDNIRESDDDNPKGYFEYEPVKKTKDAPCWLDLATGKVVKMIYRLLYDLPEKGYQYRIVFMQRDIEEVLKSQNKMLKRRQKSGGDVSDEQMAQMFKSQLDQCMKWLEGQENFSVTYVLYSDMIADPMGQCQRVNDFLDGRCDIEEMAGSIDPSLYRNKT